MKTRLVYLQSGFLKKVRNNISIKEEKYGFTLSKLYEMMSYTIDTSICTDMTLAEIEDDELLGPLSCETYCSNFEIKPDSKDIIENALTSTEENIEDLSAIYMLNNKTDYDKQKGILAISPDCLPMKTELIEEQSILLKQGETYDGGYSFFNNKLRHECNSMIIIDPFILTEKNLFKTNLFSLLNSILPEQLDIPFHLSIFSQIGDKNKGDNKFGNDIYYEIIKWLTQERKELNIELSIFRILTGSGFHDRFIITNNVLIEVGAGFNLFNSYNISKHNTKISKKYPRFFKPDGNEIETYLFWISFAKKRALSKIEIMGGAKWGDGNNRLFDMIENTKNNNSPNKTAEIKKSSVQHQETCSNNIASNSKTKDSKTEYIYLKISAERYPEIEQKPLNSKQELEENRSTNEYKVIKIPFIENSELESRILYYSPDIEVIEPECLKEKIVNRLSDTLNKYKKNPSMQKGCIVNV